MLKQSKMFFYRAVKSKSFYVMLLVHTFYLFLMTYIMGEISGRADAESVTWVEVLEEYVGAGAFALFTSLFAAISVCGDFSSGYIKNVAGRVRRRWYYVASKAIVVVVYTVFSFAFCLFIEKVWCIIFGVKLVKGPDTTLYCFSVLINAVCITLMGLAIAEFFRKMGASVALVIILVNGLFTMLIEMFTSLVLEFSIAKYLPVGYLMTLSSQESYTRGELWWLLGVSCIYAVIYFLVSCIDFTKRDAV